jgi:hypothetical protein
MSHPMRFLVLGGVLVILGACSDRAPTAPAADANPPLTASGKPTRSPVPAEPFEISAGLICSFAVGIEFVVNNDFATTFPPEPNGDVVQIITGRLVARFTNLSTGTSITENISGPGRFTFHPDGSATLEFFGRSGQIFVDVENAGTKLFNFSGRLVLEIAPTGLATLVSQSGHEEDLCAALS